MELEAMDVQVAVAHRHDLAVCGGRADLEVGGENGCRQGVVAPDLELVRESGEESLSVVPNRARLPVHELPRRADLAAEGLHDRLVTEADAERRCREGEASYDLQRCDSFRR